MVFPITRFGVNRYSVKMAILATVDDSVRAGLGWKEQMKRAIRDPHELMKRMGLPAPSTAQIQACRQFGLFVTEAFLSRMEPGNAADPLLRQILPVCEENLDIQGFSTDPLGEEAATTENGLLQKYQGRVLLIANSVCAVNCRYCFRRHFPYEQTPHSQTQWSRALKAIENDQSIHEVIFSGGDPLTLSDERLDWLVRQVDAMPHISRIRFHTRLPIVIPDRINQLFVSVVNDLKSKAIVVIHSNHANEWDKSVEHAIGRLRQAGCQLLNQSVLLRGINDDMKSMIDLSQRLIDCDVLPYYLHQLDPVQGAAHFKVEEEVGISLIRQMRAVLPGYAVPRFVKEEPGQPNKTVIA